VSAQEETSYNYLQTLQGSNINCLRVGHRARAAVRAFHKTAAILLSSGEARPIHIHKLRQTNHCVGNGVSIYGSISGSGKDINITLDNQTQTLNFSSQRPSGGLIWSKTSLSEGDHQLLVSHPGNGAQPGPGQSGQGGPRAPESTLSLNYILSVRSWTRVSLRPNEISQAGTRSSKWHRPAIPTRANWYNAFKHSLKRVSS
jgi:hypothetical protein